MQHYFHIVLHENRIFKFLKKGGEVSVIEVNLFKQRVKSFKQRHVGFLEIFVEFRELLTALNYAVIVVNICKILELKEDLIVEFLVRVAGVLWVENLRNVLGQSLNFRKNSTCL